MENQNQNSSDVITQLDTTLANIRAEWVAKIQAMTPKISKIATLTELQVECFTERQIAVDDYSRIRAAYIKVNSTYKSEYGRLNEYYTHKSQIRYPNESSKSAKINSDLSELVAKRDMLESHKDFMAETIKSIDNIIWGIKDRITIQQLLFEQVK